MRPSSLRRTIASGIIALRDRLGQAGFDFAGPAFVSWLGTTMHLEESAIEQTVSVIGGFASGTEIVVDYMLPAAPAGPGWAMVART